MIRYYVCQRCKTVEQVSQYAGGLVHNHGLSHFYLQEISEKEAEALIKLKQAEAESKQEQ